jgi:hypothetical protein
MIAILVMNAITLQKKPISPGNEKSGFVTWKKKFRVIFVPGYLCLIERGLVEFF